MSQQRIPDAVLNIPLEIRVELGSRRMAVSDIVELSRGQVLELERDVDQPVDIYVGEVLVARGDVVIANEYNAVRIISVASDAAQALFPSA